MGALKDTATIIVTVLLVGSIITPTVAMPPSTAVGNTPDQSTPEQTPTEGLEPGKTSLAYRTTALEALQDTSLSGGRADRLETELKETTESYLDTNRTTAGPFKLDRQIIAQTQQHEPEIAQNLLLSDAVLAHVAVQDAERAIRWARRNNRSVPSDVVEDVQAAREHLNHGDRLRSGPAAGPAPVEQYRKAWSLAQGAIITIDQDTKPVMDLRFRADPPHNETLEYPVVGNVSDPRLYEISNVTVEYDGETKTVPLNQTNSTFGKFNTSVAISGDRNTIRVVAVDPAIQYTTGGNSQAPSPGDEDEHPGKGKAKGHDKHHDKNKGKGSGKNPRHGPSHDSSANEDGQVDDPSLRASVEQKESVITLRLDADGLPDQFEETTVGTDPLSTNSDANATSRDESRNKRVDGAEDFDGDGLIAFHEYRTGGDPLDTDTDGDGLSDGFEYRFSRELDLLSIDSDGDGVPDSKEDFDGDGLSADREDELNGSIYLNDTDGDSLADPVEAELGTKLDVADSDGDGLTDAEELRSRIDTDPMVPDMDGDGDGILDGNETYQTRATDPETGATALLTGEGNVAGDVQISRNSQPLFNNYSPPGVAVSPYVSFESNAAFESA
jgi:hypothetical protein